MPASSRAHLELVGPEGLRLAEGMMTAADPRTFELRGAHWAFGDVLLSDLTLSPVTIEQVVDPIDPLTHDGMYFSVGFVLQGEFTIDLDGIPLPFGEGSAAFVANWASKRAWNSTVTRVLYLSVPRSELHAYGIDPDTGFAPIDPSALEGDALLPFLCTLLPIIQNHSIPTEPTATILVRLVAELFINDEAQFDSGDVDDRLLVRRAREVISRESDDQRFGPTALADALEVSAARLEAAFERSGNGDTVRESIECRRLTRAVELLGRPAGETAPSIHAAAANSGFADTRTLDRAIRATFGVSVIELLAGLHRLNPEDFPDQGGKQTAVSRVRGPGWLSRTV